MPMTQQQNLKFKGESDSTYSSGVKKLFNN